MPRRQKQTMITERKLESLLGRPTGCEKPSTRLRNFSDRIQVRYLLNALSYAGRMYSDEVVKLTLSWYDTREKKRLMRRAHAHAAHYAIDCDDAEQNLRDGTVDIDETLQSLFSNARLKAMLYREAVPHLTRVYERSAPHDGKSIQERKLSEMQKVFGLSDTDRDVLTLLYLYEVDARIEQFYDDFVRFVGARGAFVDLTVQGKQFAILCNRRAHQIMAAGAVDGALCRTGLLSGTLDLPREVVLFLEGRSRKPMTSHYFDEYGGRTLALGDHLMAPADLQAIDTLVNHREPGVGINILLYGAPGTGKTELARTLGRHYGLKTYEIRNIDESRKGAEEINAFRQRAFLACQHLVGDTDALVVVDEADSMLNAVPDFFSMAPIAEKGQVNRLLDNSRVLTIWITNRWDGIDDSTCRRFDYAVKFEKLTFEQRCSVWRNALKKHRLVRCFSADAVEHLAGHYQVSAGGIAVALRNVSRTYRKTRSTKGLVTLTETFLTAHRCMLEQNEGLSSTVKPATSEYALDGLNIEGNIERTLMMLDRFNSRWPTPDTAGELCNLNLLLYGPSGTGKTEFAKYVARRLKRRMLVRRASDLLSMYVGQTEKLIQESFTEAQNDNAILFIDEADSLFGNREGATHQWEVSQVNELLTCMEAFRGMLICSTNFKGIIDTAAMRRFAVKLRFNYLSPLGVVQFYQRLLAPLVAAPLSASHRRALGAVGELAPGDFKVVRQNSLLLEKADRSHEALITALRDEAAARAGSAGTSGARMGFTRGK